MRQDGKSLLATRAGYLAELPLSWIRCCLTSAEHGFFSDDNPAPEIECSGPGSSRTPGGSGGHAAPRRALSPLQGKCIFSYAGRNWILNKLHLTPNEI